MTLSFSKGNDSPSVRVYQTETETPTSAEGLETQRAIQSVLVKLSAGIPLVSGKTCSEPCVCASQRSAPSLPAPGAGCSSRCSPAGPARLAGGRGSPAALPGGGRWRSPALCLVPALCRAVPCPSAVLCRAVPWPDAVLCCAVLFRAAPRRRAVLCRSAAVCCAVPVPCRAVPCRPRRAGRCHVAGAPGSAAPSGAGQDHGGPGPGAAGAARPGAARLGAGPVWRRVQE